MRSGIGSVSVVMPAFNLELKIKDSVSLTDKRLGCLDCDYEILVVDDGSRDATRSAVESMDNSHVRVLGYDRNQGNLYALRKADIVVGSKLHPDSVVVQPFMRKILSLGFNVTVRLMTGITLQDT